jgi:hypothetical protein
MKRSLLLSLAAGLMLVPMHASAQVYSGIPDAEEYLGFVSGSGVSGTFGVQVGPYVGKFLSDPGQPQFSIYCVDFDHYAGTTAVSTAELGSGDLSLSRLGGSTASRIAYTKAAYLASLFDSWSDYGATKSTVWSSIHAAIWTTIRGETGGLPVPNQLVYGQREAFMALADDAVTNGWTADGWYLLTPNADVATENGWTYKNGQEFLIRTTSVPEPSTLLLIGTGLFLVYFVRRRRLPLLEGRA